MFLDFLKDIDNYESRKLAKEAIYGLIVSTVYTSDEGYETAICDAIGCWPVERYETAEQAIVGHERWLADAETLTHIDKLGWSDIPETFEYNVELQRIDNLQDGPI